VYSGAAVADERVASSQSWRGNGILHFILQRGAELLLLKVLLPGFNFVQLTTGVT